MRRVGDGFAGVAMTNPKPWSGGPYRAGKRALEYIKNNPHMGLSVALFGAGAVAMALKMSTLAGALFGAGAALLGAWITELNKRRTDAKDKAQRQGEAQEYVAPELYRTIERVLYINDRATANFICASAENHIKPNDLKDDLLPYWPALYPNASGPGLAGREGRRAHPLLRFPARTGQARRGLVGSRGSSRSLPSLVIISI